MTTPALAISQFAQAVERLKEALAQSKTDLTRDSAIKRFELAFDTAWKALKAWLEAEHGVRCASPKSCFKEAYAQGLLAYDDAWLQMTDDRNLTAHVYLQSLAETVYGRLAGHLVKLQALVQKLQGEKKDA